MAKKKKTIPKKHSDADRRIRQADRMARIFRVLQLIQSRGRCNANEIAAENECDVRTVYRDLNALELAGVPYYFDDRENCYRIRPGWQFPVLNLSPEELIGQAVATAVTKSPGLGAAGTARATTSKLAARSSEEAQRLLRDADDLVKVLDLKLADHAGHLETIKTIQWALLERKQLAGQYASPYQAKPVKVTLDPFRLCLVQQAWYLIARPTGAEAPRTYRATRFKTLRMLDKEVQVPESFDLAEYFGNAWAVYRGEESYDVAVRFTKEAASLVTETKWHATQQAEKHADGSVTLKFRVDGLEEIVWWLLGWSGRAKVIQPEKLRAMVAERLRDALAMNGGV